LHRFVLQIPTAYSGGSEGHKGKGGFGVLGGHEMGCGVSRIMIEQVAGPVGEALIMTAFGLFVAIPAVLAYNALTRSNRMILSVCDAFANDLRAHCLNKG
jgi:hypothetical protein